MKGHSRVKKNRKNVLLKWINLALLYETVSSQKKDITAQYIRKPLQTISFRPIHVLKLYNFYFFGSPILKKLNGTTLGIQKTIS